ncbi:MAG: hypothetical protein KDD99_29540, partial [Bacteroidetes bacterium]|nr:hypothetical protein [Bacteroidota bacterium]
MFSQVQLGGEIYGDSYGVQVGKSISISADGNRIAVGSLAPLGSSNGKVRIFDNVNGSWVQVGGDIIGNVDAVSLSANGSMIAIGDGNYDNSGWAVNVGFVRVFSFIGGSWTQVGDNIIGTVSQERSGSSVALSADGNRVVIGAPGNAGLGFSDGSVGVYELSGGYWFQVGSDIMGEEDLDEFGASVAISNDGNRIIAGAPYNSQNGEKAGHVRAFELAGGNWVQVGTDIDGDAGDYLGYRISLSGNGKRLAVGSTNDDIFGQIHGYVKVYELANGSWNQIGSPIYGEKFLDAMGNSVSLSDNGNRLIVAAPGADGTYEHSGISQTYDWENDDWVKIGNIIEGKAIDEAFCKNVVLSRNGKRVIIGNPNDNYNDYQSGLVRVYELPYTEIEECDVVYFPFTNGSRFDTSVHMYEGQISGGVNLAYDRLGKANSAFEFNGIDGKIDFGNSLGNFGESDFTVSFWFKTSSRDEMMMVGKREVCDFINAWNIYIKNGIMGYEMMDPDGGFHQMEGSLQTTVNEWHHIALVRQGGKLKLYLDNNLEINSSSPLTANIHNSASLIMGKEICSGISSWVPYKGRLDDLKIFHCAVDEEGIQDLYTVSNKSILSDLQMSVYPNPSHGIITLESG